MKLSAAAIALALALVCGCKGDLAADNSSNSDSGSTGDATAGSGSTATSSSTTGSGTGHGAGSGTGAGSTGTANCSGALPVVFRDFQSMHPDFQNSAQAAGIQLGLVENILGADGKPVFLSAGTPTPAITSQETFDEWYRDVDGVNLSVIGALPVTYDAGVGVFDDQSFFPLDGKGFGDEGFTDSEGFVRNFHFTSEIHTEFIHEPGQTFQFIGDDDVWIFIGGELAIDLGGLHGAAAGAVDLDTLMLDYGNTYSLDIFHAERHTEESTFWIETTIGCCQFTHIEC